MAYSVKIEQFEGPLDLLSKLVESEKLEITQVSLLEVTEPFLTHVREHQGQIPPQDLADFLIVAAKLVYLKSKALMPDLYDEELEEGPDLEEQLRLYRVFAKAAERIDALVKNGRVSFSRSKRRLVKREPLFSPPEGITSDDLRIAFLRVAKRLEPILRLPKVAVARSITIEDKIDQLTQRVRSMMRVSFHKILAESKDRYEMVVSFLALLELVKQRIVQYDQPELFKEITLQHTKE